MRTTTNLFVQGLCGVVTNRLCQSSLKAAEGTTVPTDIFDKEIDVDPDDKVQNNYIKMCETQQNGTIYNEKLWSPFSLFSSQTAKLILYY